MLALIDLKAGKAEEAREQLESVVSDEDVIKAMPSYACWIIGQELDGYEETQPLGIRLFEQAVKSQTNNRSQLRYTPVVRLVELYADSGRAEDARELLQDSLRKIAGNASNIS